ncbi:MAG: cupin domain-containing protein [Halioglobus sp.]
MRTLLLVSCFLVSVLAMSAKAELNVLGLDTGQLRTMELESIPPWPDELVLSGTNKHWQKILHMGEFVVVLYESEAAVIDVSYPFPYDEYVLVIEGEVILTSTSGDRQRYGVGESFVVPKGWMGTWDMPVKYREKIVVERKAWDESED